MHVIQIDNEEAIKWFEKLINNTLADPNSPALKAAYSNIEAWKKALDNKMSRVDILKMPEIDALIQAEIDKQKAKSETELAKAKEKLAARKTKKKTTKKTPEKVVEANPYVCPQHPKYTAARSPRTDCAKCWALYKQFHPLEYTKRRRDFLRKLKTSN